MNGYDFPSYPESAVVTLIEAATWERTQSGSIQLATMHSKAQVDSVNLFTKTLDSDIQSALSW